ncbi:MAG: hypothetical protein AAGE38_11110, partial [Pseudomonadota bacterium]
QQHRLLSIRALDKLTHGMPPHHMQKSYHPSDHNGSFHTASGQTRLLLKRLLLAQHSFLASVQITSLIQPMRQSGL